MAILTTRNPEELKQWVAGNGGAASNAPSTSLTPPAAQQAVQQPYTPSGYTSKRMEDAAILNMGGKDTGLGNGLREANMIPSQYIAGMEEATEGMIKAPLAGQAFLSGLAARGAERVDRNPSKAISTAANKGQMDLLALAGKNSRVDELRKQTEELADRANSFDVYNPDNSWSKREEELSWTNEKNAKAVAESRKNRMTVRDFLERTAKEAQEYEDETGSKLNLATFARTAGQMAPSQVAGVAGAAGLGLAEEIGSLSTMFAQVYGNSWDEAVAKGADPVTAGEYAASHAALEVSTELLSGGTPGMGEGATGRILKKWGDQLAAKGVTGKAAGTAMGKAGSALAGWLTSNTGKQIVAVLGEGVEEVIAEIFAPFIDRATIDPDAENASIEDLALAFLGGAGTSLFMSGARMLKNAADKGYYYRLNDDYELERVYLDMRTGQSARPIEVKAYPGAPTAQQSAVTEAATPSEKTGDARNTVSSGDRRDTVAPSSVSEAVAKGTPSMRESADEQNRAVAGVLINKWMSEGLQQAKSAFTEGGILYDRYGDLFTPEDFENLGYAAGFFNQPFVPKNGRIGTWEEIDDYIQNVAIPQQRALNEYISQVVRAERYARGVADVLPDVITADLISGPKNEDQLKGLTKTEKNKVKKKIAESLTNELAGIKDPAEKAKRKAEMLYDNLRIGAVADYLTKQNGEGWAKKAFGSSAEALRDAFERQEEHARVGGTVRMKSGNGSVMMDINQYIDAMFKSVNPTALTPADLSVQERQSLVREFNKQYKEERSKRNKFVKEMQNRLHKNGLKLEVSDHLRPGGIGNYDPETKTIRVNSEVSTSEALRYIYSHELIHSMTSDRGSLFLDKADSLAAALGYDLAADAESLRARYGEQAGEEAATRFTMNLLGDREQLIELSNERPALLSDLSGYLDEMARQFPIENIDTRIEDAKMRADVRDAAAGTLDAKVKEEAAPLAADTPTIVKETSQIKAEEPAAPKAEPAVVEDVKTEAVEDVFQPNVKLPEAARKLGFKKIEKKESKKKGKKAKAEAVSYADDSTRFPLAGCPGLEVKAVLDDRGEWKDIIIIADDTHQFNKKGTVRLLTGPEKKFARLLTFEPARDKSGVWHHEFTKEFFNALRSADPRDLEAKASVNRDKSAFLAEYPTKDSGVFASFTPDGRIRLAFRDSDGKLREATTEEYFTYCPSRDGEGGLGFARVKDKDYGSALYAPYSIALCEILGLPRMTKTMRNQNNRLMEIRRKMFIADGAVKCDAPGFEGFTIKLADGTKNLVLSKGGKDLFVAPYSEVILDAVFKNTNNSDLTTEADEKLKRLDEVLLGARNQSKGFYSHSMEQELAGEEKAAQDYARGVGLVDGELERVERKVEDDSHRKGMIKVKYPNSEDFEYYPKEMAPSITGVTTDLVKEKKDAQGRVVAKDVVTARLPGGGSFIDPTFIIKDSSNRRVDAPSVYIDPRTGRSYRYNPNTIPQIVIDNDTGKTVWDASRYDQTKLNPGEDIRWSKSWFEQLRLDTAEQTEAIARDKKAFAKELRDQVRDEVKQEKEALKTFKTSKDLESTSDEEAVYADAGGIAGTEGVEAKNAQATQTAREEKDFSGETSAADVAYLNSGKAPAGSEVEETRGYLAYQRKMEELYRKAKENGTAKANAIEVARTRTKDEPSVVHKYFNAYPLSDLIEWYPNKSREELILMQKLGELYTQLDEAVASEEGEDRLNGLNEQIEKINAGIGALRKAQDEAARIRAEEMARTEFVKPEKVERSAAAKAKSEARIKLEAAEKTLRDDVKAYDELAKRSAREGSVYRNLELDAQKARDSIIDSAKKTEERRKVQAESAKGTAADYSKAIERAEKKAADLDAEQKQLLDSMNAISTKYGVTYADLTVADPKTKQVNVSDKIAQLGFSGRDVNAYRDLLERFRKKSRALRDAQSDLEGWKNKAAAQTRAAETGVSRYDETVARAEQEFIDKIASIRRGYLTEQDRIDAETKALESEISYLKLHVKELREAYEALPEPETPNTDKRADVFRKRETRKNEPKKIKLPEDLAPEVPAAKPEDVKPAKEEKKKGRKKKERTPVDVAKIQSLLRKLNASGAEIIHKNKSNATWVVGGPEVAAIIEELNAAGMPFTFKPGGGKATGGRDAWWSTGKLEAAKTTETSETNAAIETAAKVEELAKEYAENVENSKEKSEPRLADSAGAVLTEAASEFYRNHPGGLDKNGNVQRYYSGDRTKDTVILYTEPNLEMFDRQISDSTPVYAAIERPFMADIPETTPSISELIEQGYDGILFSDSAIVFSQSQIKDINDPNPGSEGIAFGFDDDWLDRMVNNLNLEEEDTWGANVRNYENDNWWERYYTGKSTDRDLEVIDQQWAEAGEKYGTIEGSDIPTQVAEGKRKTSTSAKTIQDNPTFVDGEVLTRAHHDMILRNAASYFPVTDKQAMAQAEKWLFANETDTPAGKEMTPESFEKAYDKIMEMAADGNLDTKQKIVAAGQVLAEMSNYIRQNEKNVTDSQLVAWERLDAATCARASLAGQTLQAFATLKKLTPQGRLYYMNEMIDSLRTDLENRKGLLRKGLKGALDKYEISPGIIKKIESLDVTDPDYIKKLDEYEQEVINEVAAQIPATLESRIVAWRYLCMLGSIRTHVRNMASNAIMAGAKDIAREISGGLQDLRGIFTSKGEKTVSLTARANDAQKAFAKKDSQTMMDVLQHGGKQGFKTRIMQQAKSFGNSRAGKILNFLSSGNSNLLEYEDKIFLVREYQKSLSRYLAANNISVDYINSGTAPALEALNKARDYALNQAWDATYRQANALAEALNKLEKDHALATVIIEGLVPFKRTPANILIQGLRYSPVGIAEAIGLEFNKVTKGEATAAEVCDRLGQGITGSGIMLLGWWLASMGLAKGAGKESDREEYYEEMLGEQKYSLNIAGKNYTIDWLTPISMPLMAGVSLYEDMIANGEINLDEDDMVAVLNRVASALAQTADPVTNLSMLQGINDALSAYKENQLGELAKSAVQSYALQFIPTASGQALRTIDPTRRTTYASKDSDVIGGKFMAQFGNKLRNKSLIANAIMGDNAEYVDMWGRTEQGEENPVLRAFNQFVAPWYARDYNVTAVDDRLAEIFAKNGDTSVLPSSPQSYYKIDGVQYSLSPEDYEQVKKTVGNLSYRGLEDAFEFRPFNQLDADQQEKVVSNIYKYAREVAKVEYTKENGIKYDPSKDYKNLEELAEYDITPGEYYTIKASFSSGAKSTDKKYTLAELGVPSYLWDYFL